MQPSCSHRKKRSLTCVCRYESVRGSYDRGCVLELGCELGCTSLEHLCTSKSVARGLLVVDLFLRLKISFAVYKSTSAWSADWVLETSLDLEIGARVEGIGEDGRGNGAWSLGNSLKGALVSCVCSASCIWNQSATTPF